MRLSELNRLYDSVMLIGILSASSIKFIFTEPSLTMSDSEASDELFLCKILDSCCSVSELGGKPKNRYLFDINCD